jgi:predicted dinucleotide-binding enzyme
MVGTTIATKLVALGHAVKMGSRKAGNEKAGAWAAEAGAGASDGSFADAAAHGEIVFNCTRGTAAVDAVKAAGEANLAGKILLDVSVPLDLSAGFPPSITFHGEDSLGEQIQRALPRTYVVKTLNTVNCNVMVDPARIAGEHDVFVSGNDPQAKATVTGILRDWFGWKSVIDLGDISTARGTEGYILMWLRLYGALKTADFNIRIVK